ncbi:MAG: chorismate mutase [Anaerolineales bacterium]
MRGVRGATTVNEDQAEPMLAATQELLEAILAANPGMRTEDIASVIFTLTNDLCSAFPALAARRIGWSSVPMMCAREIPVPGSLPCCIRVLVHWNTDTPQNDIRHIYLREAVKLRPDLASHAQ